MRGAAPPRASTGPIRVLVADDSSARRDDLTRVLASCAGLEVAGTAADGARAVRLARELAPEVVVMGTTMPELDGFAAARAIMERDARPIVLVGTSAESRDPAARARALEAGALVLVERPGAPQGAGDAARERALAETVTLMADVRVITRRPPRRREPVPTGRARRDIVAMAASTGGPAALATVLGALPATVPVPIVVVQHITGGFDRSLVAWLDRMSTLPVRLAVDGRTLAPGEVTVAPNDVHLGVTARGKATLTRSDPIAGHRPSATHLFRSVAAAYRSRALAVILTGMGSDGVPGLVEVARLGGRVLAQDEGSSVVYGMPREAVSCGAVHRVVHLCDMATAVIEELARDPVAATASPRPEA